MLDGCDDTYVIYNPPRLVRARKDHKCEECGRAIGKGDQYYSASGLYDGQWNQHYICGHCNVACEWLRINCGGFLHNSVREDIEEHVDEYRQSEAAARLARLAIGMRRKWTVKRGARAGQLMSQPRLPAKIVERDFR